ncbi:YceI family protein [Hyphomonas pacifica]|uniref:Lipid/polyisoprenoid-binding YceI-like domain-containing protein n=1 Tax=Hyphomonas pacifica TaxID=1280941 RepID=A0A062U0M5_9PROT|nr:YceI family protein [Hyphomonas pacifica]KCZ51298.1 hypothetical protein HY2_11595 [Hyphomonas pacifica]RAN33960.1 hypothetical protein HY3_11710 [Hyphomonas pacifica]
MNLRLTALTGVCALTLAACGAPSNEASPAPVEPTAATEATVDADAEWHLVDEESRLTFVSTKAEEIAEVHTFDSIMGTVSPQGLATVDVSLNSVDTNIEQRDERMRTMLFDTQAYPTLTVTAETPLDGFSDLEIGDRERINTPVTVSLHGQERVYDADLYITRIGPKKVLVETASPVLTHAADFGLDVGVEALREVANLPSISPAVPVSVSFVFEQ